MRLDGTTHGWLPLALQSPGRTPGLHASSRDVARVLTEQLYGLAFSAHSARRTLRQAERLIHDAAYGSRGEYRQCCSVQLDGALLEIYSTLVSTTSAPHFAAPNRYGDPRPHDISGPTCVTSSPTWEPCIPPAVPYFASNAVAYLDRPFSLWTGLDTSWIPNARTAPRGHNYADAALWIFRALGPVGIALEVAWGGRASHPRIGYLLLAQRRSLLNQLFSRKCVTRAMQPKLPATDALLARTGTSRQLLRTRQSQRAQQPLNFLSAAQAADQYSRAMKHIDQPNPRTRSKTSTKHARTSKATSIYAAAAHTQDLLAAGVKARTARLAAADMVSTEAAGELVGASRVSINAWIVKGRAIGLTQAKRGYRLPVWQFEPRLWAAIPQISKALGTTEGWALLNFLETPLGAFDGSTPRQAIERGRAEEVLTIAEQESV